MVAESLDYIAGELEKAMAGGKSLNPAIQDLLPRIIKQHKRVIFNGDNYAEEWHREAERRGLPNLKNTVECLPIVVKKETIELLTKYKVYSEKELQSRYVILSENYTKAVNVEAQLMSFMARTIILPAALRYQAEVAGAVNATKAAGVDNAAQMDLLKVLTGTIGDFQKATAALDKALSHHAEGDAFAHAKAMRDTVIPRMGELRTLGDKLECMVSDDLWPLPTYREMLFVK
jgi:glutamine synthetase